MEKKIKTFKVTLFMSFLSFIITGINYFSSKVPAIGVAFIVVTISFIILLICYIIEMKNIKNKIGK